VNDAEGTCSQPTPKRKRASQKVRLAAGTSLALFAVLSSTVLISTRPGAATSLATAQQQAAAIQAEVNSTTMQIGALGQQYDAAQGKLENIKSQVAQTQSQIAQTKATIAADRKADVQAVLNAYKTNGQQSSSNPLFSNNFKSFAATQEYGHVVNGTLNAAVANLTNAQDQLNAQEAQLQVQQGAAQQATDAASSALAQAQALEAKQAAALSQAKGQVAAILAQQQAAQAAAESARGQQLANSGAGKNIPNPPSNLAAGQRAVAFAESQIGVPYVWGAESPGSGFDCSGLTQWAWGQAGVSLGGHYSGAQFNATTPVPLSGLEPGDLLFWGPGGSEHVAMYVGGGTVIQAPHTGSVVGYQSLSAMIGWGNFAGAGRPE